MTDGHSLPEDRSDPEDRSPHLRARVPDHVADGAFSTGAIVVTGPNEFIIDFLQTIGRPHRVASRVIIPHAVMPQFIEALAKNLGLYRDRFGDPPLPPGSLGPATAIGATGVPQATSQPASQPPSSDQPAGQADQGQPGQSGPPGHSSPGGAAAALGSTDVMPGAAANPAVSPPPSVAGVTEVPLAGHPAPPHQGQTQQRGQAHTGGGPPQVRRPTPQEIYDDLKIPDTVLSGAYANGVMIGHGASEFGLDFLTSFYPQSAVSARVFMAAGQIPRLLESLNHAMRQLQQQQRNQQHGRPPQSGQPPHAPPGDGPRGDDLG
jgi:hypothetical protein